MNATTRPLPTGSKVHVFADDPLWDRHSRWWQMPSPVLHQLYVATYDLAVDADGDPIDPKRDMRYLDEEHPGCVFVYC